MTDPLVQSPPRSVSKRRGFDSSRDGSVTVRASTLLDTHGLCDHRGHRPGACPFHHSMVVDFIDNCVANNVPEAVIARQVRFMIDAMEEIVAMHATLQERFHTDRQREYQIGELTSALDRKERLRQQERRDLVEGTRAWRESGAGVYGLAEPFPPPPPPPELRSRRQSPVRVLAWNYPPAAVSPWRVSTPPRRAVSPPAGSASPSPLRYGRAAVHMLTPNRRHAAELARERSTRRESPTAVRRPSGPPRRSPEPRPATATIRKVPGRYSDPTHNSVARRRGSDTVGDDSARACRACSSSNTPAADCGPRDCHHHNHNHQQRPTSVRASSSARRPVPRMSRDDRARAVASVARPTRASALRAEAVQARRRQALSSDGDGSDSSSRDSTRPPSRPAPRRVPLSSPANLAPPPRMSIEKRNGPSGSRGGDASGMESYTGGTSMTLGGSQRASTNDDDDDGSSSPSFLDRFTRREEAIRRELDLRRSQYAAPPAPAPSATTNTIHIHHGGGSAMVAGPELQLTSPELQLFIEMSQRKIREAERLVTRTTPNVSSINGSSYYDFSGADGGRHRPHAASLSPPMRGYGSSIQRHEMPGHSPMVEISPTSSDED